MVLNLSNLFIMQVKAFMIGYDFHRNGKNRSWGSAEAVGRRIGGTRVRIARAAPFHAERVSAV